MSFHSELEIYIEKKEIFMKKIVKLMVSLLMVLSLTFCFAVQSFAFDYEFELGNGAYYNKSVASAYFVHNNAFSRNEKNSCTFVSLQLLLSYYDSFWSNRFILDGYDYPSEKENEIAIAGNTLSFLASPGVEQENLLEYYMECADYDEFIENYKGRYFQLYLMDLAKEAGLISGLDPWYAFWHPNDEDGDYSLSVSEMVELLEIYLYDVLQLTEQQITVNSIEYSLLNFDYDEEAVRAQLVDLVSSGTPVIYCGYQYETYEETIGSNGLNKTGHAMIAYDYNPETDNVFYHLGWLGYLPIDDSVNPFVHYPSIIWLEINENEFPHECSNNYRVEGESENVCLCKFDIHPAHTHSLACIESDASSHIPKCSDCNEIDENALSYVRIDGITHSINCECGYHSVGVHIVKSGTNICLQCRAKVTNGYVAISSIGQEVSINSIQIDDVTHIADNGIIVLSDEDYEDFINGTLTIQQLYERLGLAYD